MLCRDYIDMIGELPFSSATKKNIVESLRKDASDEKNWNDAGKKIEDHIE
jgi:hypothetical protein